MQTTRRLLSALPAIGLALGMLATPAQAQDTLRIGVEGAYPPFSYVTPEGELAGFDVDIARALCDAMNTECTLVQQDWDGIIPALLARKYDAIVASMSMTPERKRAVDFTVKYYQTPARFVAEAGTGLDLLQDVENEESITIGDLDDYTLNKDALAGKTVGVQRATTHDTFISDNFGDTVEIRRYGTQDEANLDLVSGRLDLVLADVVVLEEGLLDTEQGQGFEFVGPGFTDPRWYGEGIGIAVRKNDDELRQRLNAAIAQIREDGTYQEIQDQYFDFDIYGG
ncbi:MAG: ABC transporter substrate-binding protein [Candidatus Competibacterales bacterium]|nr:ABC transporter substrate-binding protein [Candidatus Competibacterales bacterium]